MEDCTTWKSVLLGGPRQTVSNCSSSLCPAQTVCPPSSKNPSPTQQGFSHKPPFLCFLLIQYYAISKWILLFNDKRLDTFVSTEGFCWVTSNKYQVKRSSNILLSYAITEIGRKCMLSEAESPHQLSSL